MSWFSVQTFALKGGRFSLHIFLPFCCRAKACQPRGSAWTTEVDCERSAAILAEPSPFLLIVPCLAYLAAAGQNHRELFRFCPVWQQYFMNLFVCPVWFAFSQLSMTSCPCIFAPAKPYRLSKLPLISSYWPQWHDRTVHLVPTVNNIMCTVYSGTSVVEDRPPFGKMLKLPLR